MNTDPRATQVARGFRIFASLFRTKSRTSFERYASKLLNMWIAKREKSSIIIEHPTRCLSIN